MEVHDSHLSAGVAGGNSLHLQNCPAAHGSFPLCGGGHQVAKPQPSPLVPGSRGYTKCCTVPTQLRAQYTRILDHLLERLERSLELRGLTEESSLIQSRHLIPCKFRCGEVRTTTL